MKTILIRHLSNGITLQLDCDYDPETQNVSNIKEPEVISEYLHIHLTNCEVTLPRSEFTIDFDCDQ